MKPNVSNDTVVFQCLLEDGIPVSKLAFGVHQFERFARGDAETFHFVDGVFHFHTIRADVLHGRASYQSRNSCKILNTKVFVSNAVLNQIVPRFARCHAQEHIIPGSFHHLNSSKDRVRYYAIEVFGKQGVTTAAKDIVRFSFQIVVDGSRNLISGFHLEKLTGKHLHSEGVVGFKVMVFK